MKTQHVDNNKFVILLINNLDKEDFVPLINNSPFKKNMLVIFDTHMPHHDVCNDIAHIIGNFKKPEQVISLIKTWQHQNQKEFAGIIGLDEEYQYNVSKTVSQILNLPFHQEKTIKTITDKYLQKLALQKNNVPVPAFTIIDQSTNLENITYPNVIKPTSGISSTLVFINKNKEELQRNIQAFREKNHTSPILLEEFIGGDEYSCDFIVDKSKITVLRVVKKITTSENFPFFEGFYLFNPDDTTIPCFTLSALETLCKNIAQAMHITQGVCMVDFKYHNNNLFVIETTVRPGVSQFVELMSMLYGYTSIDILIQQIYNMKAAYTIPKSNGLVFYITTHKNGNIKTFNTDRAHDKTIPIDALSTYYDVGDIIQYEQNKAHTQIALGHVIINNIDSNQIETLISTIRKNILIEIAA